MQKAALVIKKHPEGFHFVPWDTDPHPSREWFKAAVIAHLVETGHQVKIMDGGHIKLLSGPHA